MTLKTQNIIIVGGGSAGWMSAATIIAAHPNKSVTVIESPDVPTVGVGESTLGFIRTWMHVLGVEEQDFMRYTDASYKMSIKFTDFNGKGAGGYHYPFGQPHFNQSAQLGLNDWFVKKAFYPDTPVQDYCRTFYPQMPLVENNKFNENKGGEFGLFNPKKDVAYHFDATKFANWLREKYCLPRGVKHIPGMVKTINTDEEGITSLILEDGTEITGDLYVDCTGFRSLLLGGALEEPFISYSDILPNNRAWATKVQYIDKEKELEPYTNCTALTNGWVWNIPCWERIGTGYVYSDKFISKEEALEEFKEHLKTGMTIKDSERIEDLEFKDIEMRVGIHERTWVKNVVGIGLSAGFIEPLESNGLLTIHEFVSKLVLFLGRDVVSRFDQDIYNRGTKQFFRNFSEFVSLHYALSTRRDSEYWRDITSRCMDEKVYKLIPDAQEGFADFANRKMFAREYAPTAGIHCIATGLDYYIVDKTIIKTWEFFNDGRDYKKMIDELIPIWEKEKRMCRREADDSPTLYHYLKNKIHY